MFDTVADFLHMGGYAFYVWSSYAIVLVVLALNFVAPSLKLRRARRAVAGRVRVAGSNRHEP